MMKKETIGPNRKDDEKSAKVSEDISETGPADDNKSVNEAVKSDPELDNETEISEGRKSEDEEATGETEPTEEEVSGDEEITEGDESGSADKEASEKYSEQGEDESKEKDHRHRKHSREKELEIKLNEQRDKYLRLSAEFDNYRKRMLKERIELTQFISADIYTKILPIIDDFERAMATIRQTEVMDPVRQGVELIYNKFKEHLNQQGIKEIDALHQVFNTDFHDAVSRFPVNDENLKGKIIDIVEKGYTLNDKVIRFCKVVVGD